MSDTYSFDVFDTCLTRRYACPSDVFLEIAQCWGGALEPILGADFVEVFREARVEAERIALTKSTTEETTLKAIWDELASIFPAINASEGARRELSAEADALVAVAETLALVMRARSAEKRIAFISDTYLPSDFIREQLSKAGFLQEGDICFVSSEIGKTKRQKSLYKHVLHELAITPSELHHHGDHPSSDVAIPQKLGIHARLIQTCELNRTERQLAKSLPPTSDAWGGRLVGEMRAFRVSRGGTVLDKSITSLTAGMIGPVLTAMAIWVLRKAEHDGVQTLYFFSRDGYALHRIASEMADQLGMPIQCRYLQVSRQALLLPSTSQISPAGMPWLRRHFEVPQIRLLAGKLNLPEELLVDELRTLVGTEGSDFVIQSEDQWAYFWKMLAQGKLASALQHQIDKRRKMLLAYLKQEGLFDGQAMGCVDLGWYQSCQAALIEVSRLVDPDFKMNGYYLTLAHGRGPYLGVATGQALLHQAPVDRCRLGQELLTLKNATMLEHLLSCAPHGTVHHYMDRQQTGNLYKLQPCVPFCGPTDDQEQLVKAELVEAVLIFANSNRWLAYLKTDRLAELVSASLKCAINWPETCWISALKHLKTSTDQSNRDVKLLIRSPLMHDAIIALIMGRSFSSLGINKIGQWSQLSWLNLSTSNKIFFKLAEGAGKAKHKLFKLISK